MDARTFVSALVAAAVIAMPAWAQPAPKKLDICTKKACDVSVVVGAGCAIGLVPDELGVKEGNKKVKITWTIDKASVGKVEFADDNGVFFKTSGHEKELDGKFKESAQKYRWQNKNDLPGAPKKRRYAYGVNVVQDGKACPTYDPTIINDY